MTLDDRWRALVEQGRARWCPRMRALEVTGLMGGTVVSVYPGQLLVHTGPLAKIEQWHPEDATPDWNDDATRGCLLGLVREASEDWGAHCYVIEHLGPMNGWICLVGARSFSGPTEAEALIAALEAAPC
jgi:hypothetical protein